MLVGTRYLLLCWRRAGTDALAESAQLVSIGGIPRCFVTWVTTKLVMFKEFTCRRIQNGYGRRVEVINFLKRCAEVCKSINFVGRHIVCLAETSIPAALSSPMLT